MLCYAVAGKVRNDRTTLVRLWADVRSGAVRSKTSRQRLQEAILTARCVDAGKLFAVMASEKDGSVAASEKHDPTRVQDQWSVTIAPARQPASVALAAKLNTQAR